MNVDVTDVVKTPLLDHGPKIIKIVEIMIIMRIIIIISIILIILIILACFDGTSAT